jgi:DNA repair protein RadC
MFKDIPASARPREKLLAVGPAALADAELVALLLRTGLAGTGVLQLAEQLLASFGGLAGLLRAGPDELKRIKGTRSCEAREVAAVLELARRSIASELAARPVFDSPGQGQGLPAAAARRPSARGLRGALPRRAKPARATRGDVSRHADADERLPARDRQARARARRRRGDPRPQPSFGAAEPSRADEFLTQTLKSALALVDVRVLDHLVVGQASVVSFAERGLL